MKRQRKRAELQEVDPVENFMQYSSLRNENDRKEVAKFMHECTKEAIEDENKKIKEIETLKDELEELNEKISLRPKYGLMEKNNLVDMGAKFLEFSTFLPRGLVCATHLIGRLIQMDDNNLEEKELSLRKERLELLIESKEKNKKSKVNPLFQRTAADDEFIKARIREMGQKMRQESWNEDEYDELM